MQSPESQETADDGAEGTGILGIRPGEKCSADAQRGKSPLLKGQMKLHHLLQVSAVQLQGRATV